MNSAKYLGILGRYKDHYIKIIYNFKVQIIFYFFILIAIGNVKENYITLYGINSMASSSSKKKKMYDIVHPICCTQKIAVYETRTVIIIQYKFLLIFTKIYLMSLLSGEKSSKCIYPDKNLFNKRI